MSRYQSEFFSNSAILKKLAKNSFRAIDEGFYEITGDIDYSNHSAIDLKKNIINCSHVPLITEIKYASPSKGELLDPNKVNLDDIILAMENAGSCGISILSQPFLFNGSINHIKKARKKTTLPILMKDIIVSDVQVKTAKTIGADSVLLIKTIFDKGLAETSLEKISDYAKRIGLQIILETHYEEEFIDTINTNAKNRIYDLIGINNRNLNDLTINLEITKNILKKHPKNGNIIISESGIYSKEDIRSLLKVGVDGFLVGTSLMENADNLYLKLNELVKLDE